MTTEYKLRELFEQTYQRDEWLKILGEKLSIDRFVQPIVIEGDTEAFCQLGKCTLADNNELGIYEIKTHSRTQLHRNRVQMRQLVAKHCRQRTLDGALAVYYDDLDQWRFSFISMEYQLDEKGELNRQESAPKRFTYLLGKGAKIRTAVARFSHLSKSATLDDLKTVFAVEQLNKEFYEKLFRWYENAKTQVVFPNDVHVDEGKHHSISLIRLLTRLLFVWFIKEKELVNPDFFELDKVRKIIVWDMDSSYYKAILQNLFFATLNREITDRSFRTTRNGKPRGDNYLVTNIYRYRNFFLHKDKNRIVQQFERTPFLNGGLFECLDRESTDEEKAAYDKNKDIRINRSAVRMDGFSDRDDNPLCVPNELFFNDDEDGLIQLLAQYQFTVEESTPLDADVALDPELLGNVFENLLASYNPETQQTARKASGSYYTPREIVDYMVDESLKAYFIKACGLGGKQIDHLFLPAATESKLANDEIERLIQAIDEIKVIDPAVGSGAFPMGVLQRLVQTLGIVDPENKQWKQRQVDIINELPDSESREQALREVESIFNKENRFNDFGRKLYLIKKCIYGVDIQAIAVQIAKLRFFISLIIEQQPTIDKQNNYGIKPLPNLETRFIAADSLLGLKLEKPQKDLFDTELEKLRQELDEIRSKHFNAKTLKTKRKYREKDTDKRKEIVEELSQKGSSQLTKDNAKKIANWDPYNQNTSADWFEPEWMFGVINGFDIVIGNPPYIQLQKGGGRLGKQYKNCGYQTLAATGDIYQLFYERACQLLTPQQGLLCFITSNSWLKAQYGGKLRCYFYEHHTPLKLLEMGKDIFENAIVDTSILLLLNGKSNAIGKAVDMDRLPNKNFPPEESLWGELCPQGEKPWMALSTIEQGIMDKMEAIGTPLKEWDISINYGIKTGYNDAFIIDNETKEALIAADPNSIEILKPILRGRDIKRYQAQWAGLWLIATPSLRIDIENYPADQTTFTILRQRQAGTDRRDAC